MAAYIRSDNLHKTDKTDARALADMGIDRLTKGSAGKSLWQPAPPPQAKTINPCTPR